jgi:predicted amidophosphoribosyltransferase
MAKGSAQKIGGYTWQQEQAFGLGDKALDRFGKGNGQDSLLGAVLATNLMGSFSGGGLLNPVSNIDQVKNPSNHNSVDTPVREVYCSNCAKKFLSNMKFCPYCDDPYTACLKCGSDNDKNAKKCVSCGTGLSESGSTCINCSTPLIDGALFCAGCGKSVSESVVSCKRCGYKVGSQPFCSQCGLPNN